MGRNQKGAARRVALSRPVRAGVSRPRALAAARETVPWLTRRPITVALPSR